MSLIVQKFGGSSLTDIEHIRNVARIISRTTDAGHQVVAVVSAMYGETDRLIKLARHFNISHHDREYDVLLATGEQVAAALLSMALAELGLLAHSYTAGQIKIHTSGEHGKARILDIESNLLQQDLSQRIIPVISGFQGVMGSEEITTLGRGGSDLSAVAIAAALQADDCQIYTDVDGVYTADPKIVANAQHLSHIHIDHMMEMSNLGAKVLQNRCLTFARKYQVPLQVLSSVSPEAVGTRVAHDMKIGESASVAGVVIDRHQARIALQGIPQRPGLSSYVLGPLSAADIVIDMIVQNQPLAQSLVDFSFTLAAADYQRALELIRNVAVELGAAQVVGSDQVAKLSLVGMGINSHADVATKMFSVLGQQGIDIYLVTASEIKVSAIIDEKYLEMGARALHHAFGLSRRTVAKENPLEH